MGDLWDNSRRFFYFDRRMVKLLGSLLWRDQLQALRYIVECNLKNYKRKLDLLRWLLSHNQLSRID